MVALQLLSAQVSQFSWSLSSSFTPQNAPTLAAASQKKSRAPKPPPQNHEVSTSNSPQSKSQIHKKMSAFAPQKSLPSRSVSQAEALEHVQAYLALTKSSPWLLPNARLEPTGPAAGSSGNNVTINNLERVEAGLRGEWLAPQFDLGEKEIAVVDTAPVEVEGWQDKDEFEREQSDVEGEVVPEETVVAQGREAARNEGVSTPNAKAGKEKRKHDGGEEGGPVDKKARAAEKKLRQKEEKKLRAEEKLKAQAEN